MTRLYCTEVVVAFIELSGRLPDPQSEADFECMCDLACECEDARVTVS